MAKKKIISKYPKDYVSLDINPIRTGQLRFNKSQISEQSEYYKNLNITNIIKTGEGGDFDLMLLKGKKGETACIRRISNMGPKRNLIVEFPLSLTVTETRDWIQFAHRFFKPHLISDSEMEKPNEDFKRITNGKYHTYKDFRFRRYSDPAPYGSESGLIDSIKARNKKMCKMYRSYRKAGYLEEKCIFEVGRWLVKQTIWNGRKGYKKLCDSTIQRICYSKNM